MPAAATVVNPSKIEFAVILEFASRSTTLFAPDEVVTPVPPLATANVPASVIAPVVAVLGVRPVDPAENDVTPPVDAAHVGTPEASVST